MKAKDRVREHWELERKRQPLKRERMPAGEMRGKEIEDERNNAVNYT